MINDFFARTQGRPQLLIFAQAIAPYHVLGGVKNGLRRAIILFQHDDLRVRKIALKALHILGTGPAPGVDHLVIVAHHADVAQPFMSIIRAIGKQPYQLILRQVTVLKLVNVDISPAQLVMV